MAQNEYLIHIKVDDDTELKVHRVLPQDLAIQASIQLKTKPKELVERLLEDDEIRAFCEKHFGPEPDWLQIWKKMAPLSPPARLGIPTP